MDREQLDKRLEEWLDQAAADFGKARTRPGLEARIVAGLRIRLKPRPRWRSWQALTAAAAVLVLSVSLFLAQFLDRGGQTVGVRDQPADAGRQVPGAPVGRPAEDQQPGQTASAPRSLNEVVPKPAVRNVAQPQLPSQEVFPSAGLSEQDRLLLAYARAVSGGGVTGLMESDPTRPIEIPKLEIPKLEIAPIKIEPLPGDPGDLWK